MCNVNILHLIEGAKQAKGLTVIIDVFRAFSLECYLYDMDVKQIRPVGTQGIVNAVHADEIITGSLVNAKAVAEYIIARQPQEVSLVCMGNGGVKPAPEDELCAEYIKSILEGKEFTDFEQKVKGLKNNGGKHFFDKSRQNIFPKADFYMCIEYNKFPFVITIEKDEIGYVARKYFES